METFTFEVGFTTSRPVRPDEHRTWVTLQSDQGLSEVRQLVVTWVQLSRHQGRPVEMVTSVELLGVEI